MTSLRRVVTPSAIGKHAVLIIYTAIALFPIVLVVMNSFKNRTAIFDETLAVPTADTFSLVGYETLNKRGDFVGYITNSTIVTGASLVLILLLGAMAAFALARYRFRGREAVFLGFIAMLMIPTYTKIVPQFLIAKTMPLFGGNDWLGSGGSGWVNTWWGLIIPGAVTPFAVFLFRQFYLSIPRELEDAARIDGLGEWSIWARIASPLIKPAFVTAGLLTFQESFNNFLWPLLITTDDNKRVVQLGLSVLKESGEGFTTQWNLLMAGTTMASLPMIVLFLLTQRYFVQGLATTGIK